MKNKNYRNTLLISLIIILIIVGIPCLSGCENMSSLDSENIKTMMG